jgi:hypothetical protein
MNKKKEIYITSVLYSALSLASHAQGVRITSLVEMVLSNYLEAYLNNGTRDDNGLGLIEG